MRRSPGGARQWVTENREIIQAYNHDDETRVAVDIRGYDNLHQMITENIQHLDAIYVATPPGVHLENVRQIISALDDATTTTTSAASPRPRLKAIYVEKPCGRAAWETQSMIDELHRRNLHFFPAYVSRAHERTQVIRTLLSNNKIGNKVIKVQYTQRGSSLARGLDEHGAGVGKGIPWRLSAEHSGGGLIMDMGCHVLDRIDYLFGPIQNVKSEVLRKGGVVVGARDQRDEDGKSYYPLVEDYVSMKGTIGQCDWAVISSEGAIVECVWDFSPHEKENDEDILLVTGTYGSLRMAGMGAGLPIEVLDMDGNVVETIEFEAPNHAAQPLIQSIVNELRGVNIDDEQQNYLVKSPARAGNAIRTSEVLDAILNSYYGGRHDEFWLRSESWPGPGLEQNRRYMDMVEAASPLKCNVKTTQKTTS